MKIETKSTERDYLCLNENINIAISKPTTFILRKHKPSVESIKTLVPDSAGNGEIEKKSKAKNSTLNIPRLSPTPSLKTVLSMPKRKSKLACKDKPNSFKQRSTKELWSKVKNIIKGIISFQKMSKNIQLFGVSEENLDNNYKYINSLKRIQSIHNKQAGEETTGQGKRCFKIVIPVLDPDSKILVFWNIIIGVLMVYVVIVIPYKMAFVEVDDSTSKTIDTTINYFFIADILIIFNVAIRKDGKLVIKRKDIFLDYFKSWLILDIVASLPLTDIIDSGQLSSTNKILRLSRFSRLSKISRFFRIIKVARFFKKIAFINAVQDYININYGISRLITFIVCFIIITHIIACMWYFFPLLYDSQNNWVNAKNIQDESNVRKYLFAIYWSFTTITTCGFGDIVPVNIVEYVFCLLWVFLGVFFYSFSIGTLSTILVNMNTKANILSQKLSIINQFCQDTNLSSDICKEMKRVVIYKSNSNLFSWIEKQEIFMNLPANLKCDVSPSIKYTHVDS